MWPRPSHCVPHCSGITTMSSAARMPRWSSTPEYASVPVRSMVWIGLMRPMAGYVLFAPCGPFWSKLSAREITLPLRTRRAAATMSSGWVKLSVPISSAGPQRPQFLNFSAASRRSWRVSLRAGGRVDAWVDIRVTNGDERKMRRLAYQAAAVAVALVVIGYLAHNAAVNLEARHIASGFGFLGREAGFEISESPFLRYSASNTYLSALLVGIGNTLRVAAVGIVAATLLGAAVGLFRLSKNFLLRTLAAW